MLMRMPVLWHLTGACEATGDLGVLRRLRPSCFVDAVPDSVTGSVISSFRSSTQSTSSR